MGSIVMGTDRNAVSTQCNPVHYGIPALCELGVIGRHGRVQRSPTLGAAAWLARHLGYRARYRREASERGHRSHAVTEAAAGAVVVLAHRTGARRRRIPQHGNGCRQRAASVNAVMASSVGHLGEGRRDVGRRHAAVATVRLELPIVVATNKHSITISIRESDRNLRDLTARRVGRGAPVGHHDRRERAVGNHVLHNRRHATCVES